jgi:Transposase DDE domain
MRQRHCTITPSLVRSRAHALLSRALPWRPYGRRLSAEALLDVLLLAAALGSSLFAVVRRFAFGFSHETARKAVDANLPGLAELTEGLLGALYCFGSRALRRRRWVVAIDTHLDPFYGDRRAACVIGGKKKQGTKYFYGYATASIVHHRRRYAVGLLALTGGEKPHQIVEALLGQMSSRGLQLRAVVLDAGFNSGDVLLLLQGRGLAYAVPLQRCGKGGNRRNACWELPAGTVTRVEWKTDKGGRPVSTQAVVAQRRGERDKKAYAFGGWGPAGAPEAARQARLARRWYRKRFGIETGYRQMRQGKARTSKKDAAYRLLLVGIGLLMRQLWVSLTAQLARDRGLRPTAWVGELPLRRAWEWLADLIKRKYKEDEGIRLSSPLTPLEFA